MGTILSSKTRDDGKVVYEVLTEYDESLQLKGHRKNVRIFSEDVADVETNLSARGKNEATKYFLIPRKLRKGMEFKSRVNCQKLDTGEKIVFVYVVDKFNQQNN